MTERPTHASIGLMTAHLLSRLRGGEHARVLHGRHHTAIEQAPATQTPVPVNLIVQAADSAMRA